MATIWEEAGLENGTDSEKAEFYRECLLVDLESADPFDLPNSIRPVLADMDQILPDTFVGDVLHEVEEQILNACPAQIIGYAETHYATL